MGLIFAGIGIGAGVAPPLITFCLFHYGWRFSFWASAIFGLALGAIWFAAARDTPEDHPGISDPERHLIRVGIDPRGAAAVHGPSADGNTAADCGGGRHWQAGMCGRSRLLTFASAMLHGSSLAGSISTLRKSVE